MSYTELFNLGGKTISSVESLQTQGTKVTHVTVSDNFDSLAVK